MLLVWSNASHFDFTYETLCEWEMRNKCRADAFPESLSRCAHRKLIYSEAAWLRPTRTNTQLGRGSTHSPYPWSDVHMRCTCLQTAGNRSTLAARGDDSGIWLFNGWLKSLVLPLRGCTEQQQQQQQHLPGTIQSTHGFTSVLKSKFNSVKKCWLSNIIRGFGGKLIRQKLAIEHAHAVDGFLTQYYIKLKLLQLYLQPFCLGVNSLASTLWFIAKQLLQLLTSFQSF